MSQRQSEFEGFLSQRLDDWRNQGLYRELRTIESSQPPLLHVNGQPLINFSSNDYLGLSTEPVIREAAIRAIEHFGTGAGASRLVCGTLSLHHELEACLAKFKEAESALTFSSGYTAALGALSALLGKSDILLLDKLAHACLVDAARLCGAKMRIFAHNDLDHLEHLLQWADAQRATSVTHKPHLLIVTESVFSMDGDLAPLREIVALKQRYGAWLMVDEAHATGLYGIHRRGRAEACGAADQIEIQMGTLSKAIGSAGGYICGTRTLIDFLINRARSFVYSTAPPPAVTAAATAAINFIASPAGEERCRQLWKRVEQLDNGLKICPFARDLHQRSPQSAIIPLLFGTEQSAMQAAACLRTHGFLIPAIRYPSVARGKARLRLTVNALHTPEQISQLLAILSQPIQASLTS